ncbi:hypothetical protein L873DRAFT_1820031 [Choiromyces venosus 120613-1]|uniref:Uncharacterized protein n=1 Tax=Choiromyces venosus 120613-1 TaxID=1336337 RepID=A0A3N4J1J9_9PEZI|nr:hypothetical protein L873DRAFT_1820031 [Choiromyces venosus 120613-1]
MVDHSVCNILHVDQHDNPASWAEVAPTLPHMIAFLALPLLHESRVGTVIDKTLFFLMFTCFINMFQQFFPLDLEKLPDAVC